MRINLHTVNALMIALHQKFIHTKKKPGNKGLLMMMNCFCGMIDQQKGASKRKSCCHLDHS